MWIADRLGRKRLIWLELAAGLHLTVALTGLRQFQKLYPIVWWPIFGGLGYLALMLASKSRAEQDRLEKKGAEDAKLEADERRRVAEAQQRAAEAQQRAAEEEARQTARRTELATLVQYKGQMAGNLAHLLKNLQEHTNHARTLQGHFLLHAVGFVKNYLGLSRDDERISATWAVPVENYTQWETVAYDRNQADRQPGRRRDIKPGIPGAAEAFLTGNKVFIDNTLDERYARYFDRFPKYKAILSIPARTMNVTRNASVTIDGQANAIVGVMNIDCRETGVLNAEVSGVLGDFTYFLGILEYLNRNPGEGSHG